MNPSIRSTASTRGGKTTSVSGPGGRNVTASQVGNTTFAKGSGSNNVYAGRDGNVYRRDEGGDWQKYQGKGDGWSDVERGERGQREKPQQRPAGGGESINSLDRQYQGRQAGADRAQQYRSAGGGYAGGGGARGGGGGMRGGGGRR